MRYLKGTKNKYLGYGKVPLELIDFCDFDMAGDVDTQKSTHMYLHFQVVQFHSVLVAEDCYYLGLRIPKNSYGQHVSTMNLVNRRGQQS